MGSEQISLSVDSEHCHESDNWTMVWSLLALSVECLWTMSVIKHCQMNVAEKSLGTKFGKIYQTIKLVRHQPALIDVKCVLLFYIYPRAAQYFVPGFSV